MQKVQEVQEVRKRVICTFCNSCIYIQPGRSSESRMAESKSERIAQTTPQRVACVPSQSAERMRQLVDVGDSDDRRFVPR